MWSRPVRSMVLAALLVSCGDGPTEPEPVRNVPGSIAFATSTSDDGLSITTDKDDYQPGDTVHFTGTGWQPGDVLDIVLVDEPQTHDPHLWSVNVGEDGTFHDSTYVVDTEDLGVTFTLTATSRATGRGLTVQFTDGNPGPPFVAVGQSPNPVTAGNSATYTIQVNYAGTNALCTVNLSATPTASPAWPAPPAGGFFVFSPISVTGRGTGGGGTAINPQSTLTLTTPPGMAANTFQFTVTRTRNQQLGETCQGAEAQTSALINLVVVSATSTTVTSSQNPSIVGNPVTFTATVTTGSPATPVTTGQVSFKTGGTSCADASQVQAPQNFVSGEVKYTPSPNLALGSHIIRACYGGATGLGTSESSVTQQVNAPSNAAPVIQTIGNQTINEEVELTFTATADDDPTQTLTWSLSDGAAPGAVPAGATISGAGVFTWTPTEVQGPGDYTFDVCVTDNGTPPLSACETITVTVNEVNLPPVLAAIGAQTVDEETQLTFTASATDPDIPANTLTFSLEPGTNPVPSGAAIDGLTGAFTWTPTEAEGPGVFKFKVRVTDNGTNPASLYDEEEITFTVNEVNKPPVLAFIGSQSVDEGSLLTFTATATDPDIPANTLTFSLQTSGTDLATASIGSSSGVFTWTPTDDNPTGTPSDNYSLKVVVTDNGLNPPNLTDDEQITITVNNVTPTITSLGLDPAAAGDVYPITGQPTVKATFTDPGANDTHQCTFVVKDEVLGTTTTATTAAVTTVLPERKCESPLNAPAAGLYRVTLTVTDDDTGTTSLVYPAGGLLIVIYDPSAGFVTGGGWINSPAGACKYAACTSSTFGKATFGFVSKYITQKDKTSPVLTGNTEFQFHAGNLNFKSSSYEWLVVNGNSGRAQYKGVGTVNGASNYGFILTAYDGSIDQFRIKIWDIATGYVIYDNQMTEPDTSTLATELGGGSIIIHVPKKTT